MGLPVIGEVHGPALLRGCKEGAVFNGELLIDSEFGRYKKVRVKGVKKDMATVAGGDFPCH